MRKLVVISLLFFTACRSPNKRVASPPPFSSIDTSHYAIIPVELDKRLVSSAPLSAQEIYKIDSLIKHAVTRNNRTADQYQSIKDPDNYYKQFWATTNDKKEKLVFITCFCHPAEFPYWRSKKVFVIDGGNCYFDMELNLKTDSVYFLLVHRTAGVVYVK